MKSLGLLAIIFIFGPTITTNILNRLTCAIECAEDTASTYIDSYPDSVSNKKSKSVERPFNLQKVNKQLNMRYADNRMDLTNGEQVIGREQCRCLTAWWMLNKLKGVWFLEGSGWTNRRRMD